MPQRTIPLPSREFLDEILSYCPFTGEFRWKVTLGSRAIAGSVAGNLRKDGYRLIRIDGTPYLAHRLAFVMMGCPAPEQVDHVNHVREDNRWVNLRAANNPVNGKNQSLKKNNTSGVCGVVWFKPRRSWQSRIWVSGKCVFLGYFKSFEDAVAARKAAERRYGFHRNHGT